jgi:DNA-binding LacI/PurR family transcriptional regulator
MDNSPAMEQGVPEDAVAAGAVRTPSRRRPVSVKDVAARAGVSWKTVSNVVHGKAHVKPALRERVEQAIEELDYRPNLAGRQLRQGSSKAVVLALPDIRSPYFSTLAHEVIQSCRSLGYTTTVEEIGTDVADERRVLEGYRDRLIDGIIYSPQRVTPEEVLARRDRTPLVLLGERLVDSGLPHVAIDNRGSGRVLTRHLIDSGRRHLAFFGSQTSFGEGAAQLRVHGFLDALAEASLEAPAELQLAAVDFTREEGERLAHRLLDLGLPCDGVVCGNDLLAVGALRAFRSRGVSVPADIAVAGWDDIPEASFGFPSLTTIAPDIAQIAAVASALLVAEIEGTRDGDAETEAGYVLRVRESAP